MPRLRFCTCSGSPENYSCGRGRGRGGQRERGGWRHLEGHCVLQGAVVPSKKWGTVSLIGLMPPLDPRGGCGSWGVSGALTPDPFPWPTPLSLQAPGPGTALTVTATAQGSEGGLAFVCSPTPAPVSPPPSPPPASLPPCTRLSTRGLPHLLTELPGRSQDTPLRLNFG